MMRPRYKQQWTRTDKNHYPKKSKQKLCNLTPLVRTTSLLGSEKRNGLTDLSLIHKTMPASDFVDRFQTVLLDVYGPGICKLAFSIAFFVARYETKP